MSPSERAREDDVLRRMGRLAAGYAEQMERDGNLGQPMIAELAGENWMRALSVRARIYEFRARERALEGR